MEPLFAESRNPKIAVCGVKVGTIKSFSKHLNKLDHKHLTRHIHKIYDNVFHRINYKKKYRGDGFIPKV